jgi:pimeloyl-ACP methyl ester carboxylesterase
MSETIRTIGSPTVVLVHVAFATTFSGEHSNRVLDGVGHNVPQEAPDRFADAVLEVGGGAK